MTNSKKMLAGFLAAIMTICGALTGFAALPSDVVDSPYEESIEALNALGIMTGDDDGQFRPDSNIRRSEFAKVAVEAMGLGRMAQASNHKTKFPDVVENHWANGYINVATNQGLIIGDDEANFRPDDPISYAEAMTILVRMVGHEPAALQKGGFPHGYITVGSQNGIDKNAVTGANNDVLRGMIAQMAFNSLTVKMMEQVGFGNDAKYEVVDKTLLKDYLDVTKGKGQITALGISSISGISSLKDNEVRIGENVFTVAEEALPALRNLVGFNVTYYVRELSNGDEELILARADANNNNSISIATDNFESVTTEEDGSYLVEYWIDRDKDKKPKELIIASNAQMIYNGKAITFDSALLAPESGRITCLDISGDDIHDLVFVTSWTNLVVESVIPGSHKITDKYGNPSLVLNPEDKDVKFTLSRFGHLISLSDLKEWDVLSVAKSTDGTIISVEVSNTKVTGKVEEIDGSKRTINGEKYEIAKNYTEDIKLNDEGTFYLDIEGKIAAVDTTTALSSNYAYAVDGALSTGFDKALEIKVFNKNDEVVILKSAQKIKLNGSSGKTPQEALTALSSGGSFAPQLITYELNNNGELTQLNTATDLTGSGTINKNKFSLNASGELTYKKASGKLGSYNVNESTLILNIPTGSTDPEDYSIETLDFFDDNESYNVFVYDVAEDLTAKAIIVTSATASASIEAPIAIVDEISTILNADNETVQRLYAYQNGQRLSFDAISDDLLTKGEGESAEALERGDVIQLKLNTKNQITGIRLLFESDDKAVEFSNTIDDLEIVYGRVVKKFAGSINVQVGEGAIANYSLNDVTVYEYDSAKRKNAIRVVDANEITQYDDLDPSRVLIKIYKDAVQEIVIVK